MVNETNLLKIKLIPVIELEPGSFATQEHEYSTSPCEKANADKYWRECLADSGITGLNPIIPGSWHVSITEISSQHLEIILLAIIKGWGKAIEKNLNGIDGLNEPDIDPVLCGGLALQSKENNIVVEPACCSDLRTITDWKEAVLHQSEEWAMIWIGHPWISVKYRSPWLVLSEPHESDSPNERWTVNPNELSIAVKEAENELFRFSNQISSTLTKLDYQGDSGSMSLKLTGLMVDE